MRDSYENSPSRISNPNKSQDSKRGVFTSMLIDPTQKPNAHPYLSSSVDPHSLNASLNATQHEAHFKTREYLIPPRSNYHMTAIDERRETVSRLTPPHPEVRFHYQGGSKEHYQGVNVNRSHQQGNSMEHSRG